MDITDLTRPLTRVEMDRFAREANAIEPPFRKGDAAGFRIWMDEMKKVLDECHARKFRAI